MTDDLQEADIPRTGDRPSPTAGSADRVNGGRDTLITLSDKSTILLKGVSRVGATVFAAGLLPSFG
ncbi:MAG TPA: hypothetical protein VFW46_08695 [Stellaceae bacterium]|nr:hypothetical protein [Stellaceae bacterium]